MKFTFEVWDDESADEAIEKYVFGSLIDAKEYARKRIKEDLDKELNYDYFIVDEDEEAYHIWSDREEPM